MILLGAELAERENRNWLPNCGFGYYLLVKWCVRKGYLPENQIVSYG